MKRCLLLVALLAAACGAPAQRHDSAGPPDPTATAGGTCEGFALSLAVDHGGRPSAVAAAESFARTGDGAGYPRSGWRQTGQDEIGVTVSAGTATLHVVQVSDRTWFVDSGQRC